MTARSFATTLSLPQQCVERKLRKARFLIIFSVWPTLASSPMDILILSLRKSLSLKVGMSFCLSLSLASLSTVEPEHGFNSLLAQSISILTHNFRRGYGSRSTFFEKLSPEPNLSEKRDPDPQWSQNSKDLEAQSWKVKSWIRIRIKVKIWIWICIKVMGIHNYDFSYLYPLDALIIR